MVLIVGDYLWITGNILQHIPQVVYLIAKFPITFILFLILLRKEQHDIRIPELLLRALDCEFNGHIDIEESDGPGGRTGHHHSWRRLIPMLYPNLIAVDPVRFGMKLFLRLFTII
jgi:hypothetical protein